MGFRVQGSPMRLRDLGCSVCGSWVQQGGSQDEVGLTLAQAPRPL